jgi:hypothetical protein
MSCFHQRGGTHAFIHLHRASIAYTNAVGFAMYSLIPARGVGHAIGFIACLPETAQVMRRPKTAALSKTWRSSCLPMAQPALACLVWRNGLPLINVLPRPWRQ